MYKDVWKKLLCVAVSVCMIIGLVEVAPKVKAAATQEDGFYKIAAKDRSTGALVTLGVKVSNTTLQYNGKTQGPSINEVCLFTSDGRKTIESESWSLKGLKIDANNSDEPQYLCYLTGGGEKYDVVDEGVSNGIPYVINKASNFEVICDIQDGAIVKWNKAGSAPDFKKVSVLLNGGNTIALDPSQYTITKVDGVGSVSTTIEVTDGRNFDLSGNKTKTVNFKCCYDLGGSVADGTSKFTMKLSPDYAAYDGNKKVPEVIILDEDTRKYSYASSLFKTVYYDGNGQLVDEIKKSGEYTVLVTPSGGADGIVINGTDYFTGEYRGTFTVGALPTKNVTVHAKNLKKNQNDIIWQNGSAAQQLIYPYNGGAAVELQEYSIWDAGNNEITNDFNISWKDTNSVGVAYMIITPKPGSNYSGEIRVPYFITSELTIESLTFVGYGTYNGDNISLPFRSNNTPIVPSSETVKNSSGTKLDRGSAYNVTYAYQKEGVWHSATGAGDLNLACAGKKKIIVTGLAGYASQPTVEKEYTVAAVDMNDSEFRDKFQLRVVSPGPFYFNGTAQKPAYSFTYNGTEVDPGDYNVSWTNNTDAGTATLTVEAAGTGNFTGSKSVNFTISPISLSYASVEGPHYTYNRNPINPSVIIDGGIGHVYGADYKYQMVEGRDYEIITDENELFEGELPRDVKAAPYTLRIRSKSSNITGAVQKLSYWIDPKDIADESGFQLQGVNDGEIEWTGGDTKPALIGSVLEETTDYTYDYENANKVSITTPAAVIVRGVGNYTGTKKLTYTITPRRFNQEKGSKFTVEASANGSAGAYKIKLTVKDDARLSGQKKLQMGVDYAVKQVQRYNDSTKEWDEIVSGGGIGYGINTATDEVTSLRLAGKYKIVLEGINSYTDELLGQAACGTDISDYRANIKDVKRPYVFTGQDITPSAIALNDGSGNATTIARTCFDIQYERAEVVNNMLSDVGRIYVIAVGKPEMGYYGRTSRNTEIGGSYEITPPQWTDGNLQVLVLTNGGIKYMPNGGTPIPSVIVTCGGIGLVEGTDYTISWVEEEVKTAGPNKELTLTGINNYACRANEKRPVLYDIEAVNINDLVETHDKDAHYSGEWPKFKLRHNSYYLEEGVDYVATPEYVSGSAIVATGGGFQITYKVTGQKNYTGVRYIVIPISVTDLSTKSFKSKEDAKVGDFYIEWKLNEMVIRDIKHPTQVSPSAFTIVYRDSADTDVKLKLDKDYKIIEYGANIQPGKADNYVKIEGIGGYTGQKQIPITLFANFEGARPTSTSLLSPRAIISKKRWEEIYKDKGEKGLLELVRLFDDEENGVIDSGEYDMNWSSGFNPADPAVGNYLLRVNGGQREKHYYYGCVEIPFSIVNGIDDGNTVITLNGDSNAIQYDGTPAVVTKGSFVVKIGDVELKRDRDYEIVRYDNNDDIGEATVTLRGIGNYDGEIQHKYKVTYPIEKLVIYLKNGENSAVRVLNDRTSYVDYDYTGSEKRPEVLAFCPVGHGYTYDTHFVSEGAIALSTDYYEIEYRDNINAGTAYVIIKPGKYITGSGTRACMFTIKPASIAPPNIMYSHSGKIYAEYNGDTFTADSLGITLNDNGAVLKNGRSDDYIVYYQGDLKNVTPDGTEPLITFIGVNNYTGSYSIPVVINQKSIADNDISGEPVELVYDENPKEETLINRMNILLTTNSKKLVFNEDYSVINYYTDSTCNYTVSDLNGVLNSSTGYYFPKKQGTYYVKIEGKGNFKGERIVTVKIDKRPMTEGLKIVFTDADANCGGTLIAGEPECTYNGKPHEPAFKVLYNSTELQTSEYAVDYADNTDAGTAEITVTAKPNGNYDGTVSRTFTIKPKSIVESVTDSAIHFSSIKENYPFDGGSVEPDVIESMTITHTVDGNDTYLTKDTGDMNGDYTVSYLSEYDELERTDGAPLHSYAGKVTMTVKGIGNYTGEKKIDFYIGEDISQAKAYVNGDENAYTIYNGLKQGPKEHEITVRTDANIDLTDSITGEKRYQIAFYKNGIDKANIVSSDEIIDAATYYVAVIGVPSMGTYAKTPADKCKYTIQPKTIANCTVSGFEGMYYYTGSEIRPRGIVVTDTQLPVDDSNRQDTRSVQLTAGIDYTVGYSNNISAGKATIIVSGTGNYAGAVYGYFTIDGSNTSGNQNNDGTSQGTGSLTSGTTTIAAEDIELYYDDSRYNYMLYNGGHRVPGIRVAGGRINANNFIVTASNDINPGIATLTITGNGNNYHGTIVKNYVIKANLAAYGRIVQVEDQVYTGSYVTPNITVTCGNSVLIPGRDYQTTYSNNVNVGVATVQAQGLASSYYFGTATGSFNISNKAGGMEITGYATDYTYTGYPITPEVVVTMDGRLLNKGTDYQVYYSNNINVGRATMTVTGLGSYSGNKVIPFTIQAKNIENCLTTAVTNYSYNGSTYTPNITVTDSTNGKTLVAGTDYVVTYSNNTNPGTASITVTALSKNYTGTKVIPFKITSAAVSGLRVSTIKNNRMKLAWSAQSYADGYQICNSNNRVIAMTSNNSYVVKNLNSYTTYKYKVRSYVENSDGSVSYGNFSSAVSAKTLLNTPTLSAKSTSKGKVTLTWSKVSKASGYEIYYSTKRDGVYMKLKNIGKNSAHKCVDSGLASGEKYYYTIRAYRVNNGVKTYSSYNTIRAVTVK